MESSGEMVTLPVLIESNYRMCTIPYRFPLDDPKKPTPTELSWINLFANSIPSFKKRAESDDTVNDALARDEKFAQRYTQILEDLKKDTDSHGGPPDCIESPPSSATKLYCFVHKVLVCGECICFPEHQICVVRTYSEWVIDGEYDCPPKCCSWNTGTHAFGVLSKCLTFIIEFRRVLWAVNSNLY